jgi:diadenosine tetraphosphate (Ap4A) HIT family hydrolase
VDALPRFGHDGSVNEPIIEAECGVCRSIHGEERNAEEIVFENDLWHVRHGGAPYGVPAWMMLITKSHTPGPWAFDDAQVSSLGPTLRHLTSRLIEVTGALRIYTAWMGESWQHFHAHLVPRYEKMPKEAKAWSVFDLQRAAGAGEIEVDLSEVRRLTAAFRGLLAVSPPP